MSSNYSNCPNSVPCGQHQQQQLQSQQLLGSQFRTLLDQSTPEHHIQLSQSNNIVSQILNNTQHSPSRQSKTFVYRSESPIRSSSYGKNIVNVSTIQKKEAPNFVSISSTQNPIYVEKIVKVETSNTQEICILKQRINVLEQNNKTLTDELMELRHATPQQVEQIVYIENNDQLNQIQSELNQLKNSNSSDIECLRRLLKESENLSQCLQQEKDKLNCQLFETLNKLNELKATLCGKDNQLKTLQALNETSNQQLCKLSQELQKSQKDQQDADCLNRKIADLENYLQMKDKNNEELRGRLCQAEKCIQSLRMVEVKNEQQEADITVLRQKIEDLLRNIQCLQQALTQQDQEIGKLNQTICQQNQNIKQLQAQAKEGEQFKNAYDMKSKENEDLKRKNNELDCQARRAKQLEQNLCESERTNSCLMKNIEDLNNSLNEETMKRQKAQCELDNLNREKQCLEDKLGHSGQQTEYLNQKLAAQSQEICCLLQKLQDFEASQKQIACLENNIQFLNQQNERLKQIIAEKEQQLQKLCCEIQQLQQKVNEIGCLEEQIQRLQESLNARCNEIDGLRQRNAELEQSVQELQGTQSRNNDLENQIKGLRQCISELEGHLNSEMCKRQQLEADLQNLCREKQTLEDKLQQLCNQIEYFKQKIENLEKSLSEKDCQNSQLQQENCQLQQQLRQQTLLADEGKKLGELLNSKLKEIECLRQKLCEADQGLAEKSMIECKLQECEQNNSILRHHICEIENQLNDEISRRVRYQGDLDEQSRQRQQLEDKLSNLCQQLEFLTKQLQQAEGEIFNYKAIYCQLYQIIDEWQLINTQHLQFTQLLEQLKCKLDKKDNYSPSKSCQQEQTTCRESNNQCKQSLHCNNNLFQNTSSSGISGSPPNTCLPNSPAQQNNIINNNNNHNQSLLRSSISSQYLGCKPISQC